MQNLRQQFQDAIISKTKDFFLIFYCISEMYMKFRAFFKKKDEYPSLIISEIIDAETRGYLNVSKRSCFRTPFANGRVNGFQTLLKSARHHYYPLFSSIRGKLSL